MKKYVYYSATLSISIFRNKTIKYVTVLMKLNGKLGDRFHEAQWQIGRPPSVVIFFYYYDTRLVLWIRFLNFHQENHRISVPETSTSRQKDDRPK